MLNIDLSKLNFVFYQKPLLIGGMAMEYYGIRKAGSDIDFVVSTRDHARLVAKYPNNIKDLFGDIGIIEFEFEIWNTICRTDYEYLKVGAAEEDSYLVVSIQKLLLLKAMAMKADQKNADDVELIGAYLLDKAYGKR